MGRTSQISWSDLLPQPLIVEPNAFERNLLSYKKQYAELIEALASSGHDIVVLSGDVHFGRIAEVVLGSRGAKMIEIISSPMSNMTYLEGVATAVPTSNVDRFPSIDVKSCTSNEVQYLNEVSITEGNLLSPYPRDRTKEHFMTLSFNKRDDMVHLNVEAWLVRDNDGIEPHQCEIMRGFVLT